MLTLMMPIVIFLSLLLLLIVIIIITTTIIIIPLGFHYTGGLALRRANIPIPIYILGFRFFWPNIVYWGDLGSAKKRNSTDNKKIQQIEDSKKMI